MEFTTHDFSEKETILRIAAGPAPAYTLYRRNGRFLLFENEAELGAYTTGLTPVGEEKGYDHAFYLSIDSFGNTLETTSMGYLALGMQASEKGGWHIINTCFRYPAREMVNADTFPEAKEELYSILGLPVPGVWINLATGQEVGLHSGLESTPDWITDLRDSQIFVFGSNIAGRHGDGAARIALEKFGAVWGKGVGLQGRSYAIPTMDGSVEKIAPYIDGFRRFACSHPELEFLVTRIGCGIAGYTDRQIAPLFQECLSIPNIVLPQSFIDIIEASYREEEV